jgi:hypothetical protein
MKSEESGEKFQHHHMHVTRTERGFLLGDVCSSYVALLFLLYCLHIKKIEMHCEHKPGTALHDIPLSDEAYLQLLELNGIFLSLPFLHSKILIPF